VLWLNQQTYLEGHQLVGIWLGCDQEKYGDFRGEWEFPSGGREL